MQTSSQTNIRIHTRSAVCVRQQSCDYSVSRICHLSSEFGGMSRNNSSSFGDGRPPRALKGQVGIGTIACLAFCSNLLLCVVIMKKRSMLKKPYNILILNLAITDLITGKYYPFDWNLHHVAIIYSAVCSIFLRLLLLFLLFIFFTARESTHEELSFVKSHQVLFKASAFSHICPLVIIRVSHEKGFKYFII